MHQERLLDAAHFIENNLFEDIRAADIASQICLSERSLQRHFTQHVGESLASFVRGRRLTRAAERLHQGAPDILALALDCQFSSHEAFTRAFQQQFFMTPSAFRQHGQLSHSYCRPVLDEPALLALQRQWQHPPLLTYHAAQAMWGWWHALGDQPAATLHLPQYVQQISQTWRDRLPATAPQVLMCKQPGPHGLETGLLLACPALSGRCPPEMLTFSRPAGWRATFTLHGPAQLLPVFLYHCYAQWLFFQGWHHADAPIELCFPDARQPYFQLCLPVNPHPLDHYRLW